MLLKKAKSICYEFFSKEKNPVKYVLDEAGKEKLQRIIETQKKENNTENL